MPTSIDNLSKVFKIAALLISILKITILLKKLIPKRLGIGNDKVNRFGVGGNSIEHAKKLGKLFKLEKSKSKKIPKS